MAYAQQPMMQPMMQPVMGVPTTVVVVAGQQSMGPPRDWTYGLFDCFGDCGGCLLACCCPCVSYGQTKQNLNHASGCIGDCIVGCLMAYIGCWCCLGGSNRSTIRAKYNIMGDSCADCCIHTFCATCALTQEKREVEAMMAAGRN